MADAFSRLEEEWAKQRASSPPIEGGKLTNGNGHEGNKVNGYDHHRTMDDVDATTAAVAGSVVREALREDEY